jgi:protein-L-isoaspartate O-methyltransferase
MPAGLAQVASRAGQSAALPDASEIIARYVEAVGGRETWLAHESRTLKFLFKGPMAQSDVTYYISMPNKLLWTVEISDGTVVASNGFNGELGWVGVDRDLGARILSRWELALLVEQMKPYFDPFDPTDFESMETIELAEFNGQDCYKVQLVSKLGQVSFWHFDKERGLLVRIEGEAIFGNYLLESTTLISDYAEFGGLLLPRKFVFKWPGGIEQTMTIQSVDFDKVPDSLFKLPAKLEETPWRQADKTVELLQLRPGHVVADMGAGVGIWSMELARRVGPEGQVLATEITPNLVKEIRSMAEYEGLDNVSSILVGQGSTGLPPQSCDRILLRYVYHELTNPETMNRGLYRALKPGGLILVIDGIASGENLKNGRGVNSIRPEVLIEEMVSAGFELVSRKDGWYRKHWFSVVLRRQE